jgi:hypothetical protein
MGLGSRDKPNRYRGAGPGSTSPRSIGWPSAFGLCALDNSVLLPHTGSAAIEGRIAMAKKVIIDIKTFAAGHRSAERVIASMM